MNWKRIINIPDFFKLILPWKVISWHIMWIPKADLWYTILHTISGKKSNKAHACTIKSQQGKWKTVWVLKIFERLNQEVHKTTGTQWWECVCFHARMWIFNHHLDLETVTWEIFSKDFTFLNMGLEKAFDHVFNYTGWWVWRNLGEEELLLKIVYSIYWNGRCWVRANGTFSDDFLVQIGLHYGSVWNLLAFVIAGAIM